jgi:hypothetical protein
VASVSSADTLSDRLTRELGSGLLDTERGAQVTNIPLPAEDVSSLRKSVMAIRQLLDAREGRVGSVMEKNMTLRDLVDAGVLTLSIAGNNLVGNLAGTAIAGGAGGGATIVVGGGSSAGVSDPRPTYVIPPAITGFWASGAFNSILLHWDGASINYANFAYVEVFRYTSDNSAAAVAAGAIGTSTTTFYDDAGGAYGATYYYWVRSVTTSGAVGPLNATSGTVATLQADVTVLMDALTGHLTEAQLFSSLSTRIGLIDAADTVPGSVANRISSAVNALSAVKSRAFYSATAPVTVAGVYTLQANDLWIDTAHQNKLYVYDGAAWTLAADTRVAQAVTDIANETTQRAAADSAETSARESLYAGFGAAAGTDYKVFNQATSPVGASVGDVWTWKTAAGVETFKRWDGSAWVDSLADKRAAVYRGDYASFGALPLATGTVIGDMARTTDTNTVYVWNGTGWAAKTSSPAPVFALVAQEKSTRADAVSAVANNVTTLTSRLDNFNGTSGVSLEASATTSASAITGLQAEYTVKIDSNGYVSGFGLASTANNAAPSSTFAVRADSFYVASPSGPGVPPAMPFIVQTAAGAWGPPGMYVRDAFIANASINNAKIADATIGNAKIVNLDGAKINAGTITSAQIAAGTITADRISTTSLSAITANTGALSVTGNLTMSTASAIIAGAGYGATGGWFAGYSGGAYKFSLGNALTFDGTALTIGASSISGLAPVATSGTLPWGSVTGVPSNVSNATVNRVFTQATAPTGTLYPGDIWNNTSPYGYTTETLYYNGSSWISSGRAPMMVVAASSSASWSDSEASAAIVAKGGGYARPGDVVNLYNESLGWGNSRMLSMSSDGWVDIALRVSGNEIINGTLSAAAIITGQVFAGVGLRVGSATRSGTTMSGSGAVFAAAGDASIGGSNGNITVSNTDGKIYLNGAIVYPGNIALPTFSATIGGTWTKDTNVAGDQSIGTVSISVSGGTGAPSYLWTVSDGGNTANNADRIYIAGGALGSSVALRGNVTLANEEVNATVSCTVTDSTGRTITQSVEAWLLY